ncbi:MAG: ABC transporter permease [Limisphaerales bacterium]
MPSAFLLPPSLLTDLRLAFRQLLKNPGFTAVAVLTLAVGIGANVVVFSVAKAVLFRPLGFAEADRLMWLQMASTQTGTVNDVMSWREMEDIRENTQSFEAIATFGSPGVIWERGDRAELVSSLRVTPNLGEVLRVRPALGRMLLPADTVEAAGPVAMISHELWQAEFGGTPDVLGQTVRLEEKSHTIVGVLPPGLEFPMERAPSLGTGALLSVGVKSFWLPMSVPGIEDGTSRGARMFLPVARLKPGVTEAAARAELSALGRRLAADHPETNRHWTFVLASFRDQILGRTRQGIPLLAVAVAAVLLICCVNLANLLLARGVSRQRELAVRLALGAGRSRIVRALMVESLLLSALGGGLGILLAQGSLHGVRQLASASIPFVREASVDATASVFTLCLSLLTAGVFGLLPALWQSRVEAAESLRGGARMTGGPQIRAWQRGLLVAQIAVVLVLLASAGLLLESFRRLLGQDLGYQPRSVVALDLTTLNLPTNDEGSRFYREIHAKLAALPGVEAVGTIQSTPLTGKWTFHQQAEVFGRPLPAVDRPSLAATFVAFDFFQAMGIPLLTGRFFDRTEQRDDDMPPFVILNEAAVATLFPGESALGKRVAFDNRPERFYEVVGVVKDTRDVRLEQRAEPRFYLNFTFGGAQFAVRSAVPSRALIPLLRDTLQQFGSRVIIHDIQPMAEIVSGTVAERRFLMTMLAAYAGVALGIAVVGIFGVVAYQVAQRTNEFGIRLALGSSPTGLMRLVLLQALRLVAAGVLIGILVSLGTSRLLASQLFEVSPHDPRLLGGVSLLVLGVALAATALPARRAARVDPMAALRNE